MTLEQWLITILIEQMERIEADEMLKQIVAATSPHMERSARRRLIARLEASARSRPSRPVMTVIEHNPQAAREWFEKQGAKVI